VTTAAAPAPQNSGTVGAAGADIRCKAAAPAGGANVQESSVKTAISRTFPEGRPYSGEPERFIPPVTVYILELSD